MKKYLSLCILTVYSINIYSNLPLYEVGFIAGGAHVEDYPASNQSRVKSLSLPVFIYRGDILKNDQKGSRALFYENDRLSLDLSIGAAFSASSKDNDARKGMDDLDWLFELGPRLNYQLFKSESLSIEAELPIRFIYSTDFSFTKHRGQRLYPQIDFTKTINSKIKISTSYKLNWATEELQDYFYEVSEVDQTSTRKMYNAKGGYIGQSLSNFFSYKEENLYFAIGVKYTNYSNAANENSPLFKSKENLTLFVGFNYFFYQSNELVKK